jgi:hypothetical protein
MGCNTTAANLNGGQQQWLEEEPLGLAFKTSSPSFLQEAWI